MKKRRPTAGRAGYYARFFVCLLLCLTAAACTAPATTRPLPTLAVLAALPDGATRPPTATVTPPPPAPVTPPTPLPTPTVATATPLPPTATGTATSMPPASATQPATANTATATPTATAAAASAAETSGRPHFAPAATPQPYLYNIRLVTYYGSITGPGLGILGNSSRPVMLADLRRVTAIYQQMAPEFAVLPTYHIVSTVADPFPGPAGHYSHQISLPLIEEWVAAAAAEDVAVILDIQPGYADFASEIQRIAHLLRDPHVHLAIDPEFTMSAGGIPGYEIGQVDGATINQVQAILNDIALEIGVNKLLLVHQFQPDMVQNKAAIVDYPYVELVMVADGFGNPGSKIADYNQHAAAPGFEFGGFKLFYEWDVPLMGPANVMSLTPLPAIIIYQ